MFSQGSQRQYDAIVIGSGMTGGWAAKELTERGLRTLVLEAGGPIVPERDYGEHVPLWDMPYRGRRNRKQLLERQFVQRHCYACDEIGSRFFIDDIDNPYTTPDEKPFSWFRGRQVGGRSIMWGRQVYRWSDLDFEANAREGIGIDWPIRYKDLTPWYEHVESFIGVSGQPERLAHLPDGSFLPAMPMNCVERHVRDRMRTHFGPERMLTIGRTAVLTVPHKGREACHYCGPCHRGCITRSYFSSVNATLPAAEATGRLSLRPFSVVHSLIYDERKGQLTGVRVIDTLNLTTLEYFGRIIFLCASAIESARLLLNSRSRSFPDGLANTSGQVGRNLMDHVGHSGASGDFDGWEDHQTRGDRPNGVLVPRFRNLGSRHPAFVRGYQFQGGARRLDWRDRLGEPGIGVALKQRLTAPGPWTMRFIGFGEMLPHAENRVTLDPIVTDRWGIPAARIECAWSHNELAMRQDMAETAAEILKAAGAKAIRKRIAERPPGFTIHEMGTVRMGHDPKTSVLNAHNQAHDVPNLFVTDGACMVSSGCQNPSLTYMALTVRACHYAVTELKRGNL
jgi:choline dehydrogenase-like flavoprotein